MSIDLNSSKDYPGRIALSHKTYPDSNTTTIIALTWEDLEELVHSGQQVLGKAEPPAITTIEELEALPLYSIVRLPSGQAALRVGLRQWKLFGTSTKYTPTAEVWLPAVVLQEGK